MIKSDSMGVSDSVGEISRGSNPHVGNQVPPTGGTGQKMISAQPRESEQKEDGQSGEVQRFIVRH